jgi:hypothetical protein
LTDVLAFWQLTAVAVAVVFVIISVVAVLRLQQLPTVVLVLSLMAIPTLGLVAFALNPQPISNFDAVAVALPFIGIAFVLLLANLALRMSSRSTQSFAAMHRRVPLFLIAWPCIVAAISVFIYLFEPAFAIANVAVNAAWFATWLPRGVRRHGASTSYVIAAPRSRVFAYISDPSHWTQYNPGIESVSVNPAGPLAVGSEITFRQRVAYPGLRGPRMLLPSAIEMKSRVTRIEAGVMIATRRVDLHDSSDSVELADVDGRTQVTTKVQNVLSYRYAVLGMRLAVVLNRRRLMATVAGRQAKLKQLLEEPSSQP